MNRLQTELHRLYLHPGSDAATALSTDPQGRVRALVMALRRPPDWAVLGRVWHGVQNEFGLPAPGIAVSGDDALQLWFSLAAAIPGAQAGAWLEALRARFLGDVEPSRIRLWPSRTAAADEPPLRLVPQRQEASGNWSAFVAPDLAPVFADAPFLDMPPNEEGQATLLAGLVTLPLDVFEAASKRLGLAPPAPQRVAPVRPVDPAAVHISQPPASAAMAEDPRHFLQRVMGDESVALALRVEAAKALLRHAGEQRVHREE